jgi:hypothetical protein
MSDPMVFDIDIILIKSIYLLSITRYTLVFPYPALINNIRQKGYSASDRTCDTRDLVSLLSTNRNGQGTYGMMGYVVIQAPSIKTKRGLDDTHLESADKRSRSLQRCCSTQSILRC